jgi:general secretion pathway protein G
MFAIPNRFRRAFSLIELVIVIVIIGIIAAIAIPRMSRGAEGASENALTSDLRILRNALDMFHAEHGFYPDDVSATFANQMTMFTDAAGATSATKTATHIYGPYLRTIPPLPVGAAKGNSGVAAANGAGVGWIYTESSGAIRSNTTGAETDAKGVAFNTY